MRTQPIYEFPHFVESLEGSTRVIHGAIAVPEDWRGPNKRDNHISYFRFDCQTSKPGPPIFYLAGGPGVSGTERAITRTAFFTFLSRFADVYAIDQRGVGMSRPNLDLRLRFDLPFDRPLTRELLMNEARRLWDQCREKLNQERIDWRCYTTAESVRDIAALREAIGAEKVVLLGGSYGSHLGLACLREWPEHVARAVIYLVEGPNHTFKMPSGQQSALENLQQVMSRDEHWKNIDLPLVDSLKTLIRALYSRPESWPLDVPDGAIVLGGFDLQKIVSDRMGNSEELRHLPKHIAEMKEGDFSWLAGCAADLRRAAFENAMTIVADCASGSTSDRMVSRAKQAKSTVLSDLIDLPISEMASAVKGPDLGDDFRANFCGDVPTQFLSGDLDGRTPPSNAEELLAGFTRAGHILVKGGSHDTSGQFERWPGTASLIGSFLAGGAPRSETVDVDFVLEPPSAMQN